MALSSIQYEWQQMQNYYVWCLSLADKRVADWPLMSSPVPTLALAGAYLMMVKVGPIMMKDRKPFNFGWLLFVYNLAIMMLNLYIGVELAVVSYKLGYSWFCQPVDYSDTPDEVRIAAALWWYYISKLVEFCDTLIFILRKKNNQLTLLHVYHHSTMFSLWWIGVKFVAGGSSFLAAMMNSFVHVIMYSYYGLSALGPRVQRYLWWKRHITCIQLVQFSSAGVLGIRALIVGCSFPLWMQYALVVYMISFIVLFGEFYIQSYKKKGGCIKSKGVTAVSNGSVPNSTYDTLYIQNTKTQGGVASPRFQLGVDTDISNGGTNDNSISSGSSAASNDSSSSGGDEGLISSSLRGASNPSANGVLTRAQARREGRSRKDM